MPPVMGGGATALAPEQPISPDVHMAAAEDVRIAHSVLPMLGAEPTAMTWKRKERAVSNTCKTLMCTVLMRFAIMCNLFD